MSSDNPGEDGMPEIIDVPDGKKSILEEDKEVEEDETKDILLVVQNIRFYPETKWLDEDIRKDAEWILEVIEKRPEKYTLEEHQEFAENQTDAKVKEKCTEIFRRGRNQSTEQTAKNWELRDKIHPNPNPEEDKDKTDSSFEDCTSDSGWSGSQDDFMEILISKFTEVIEKSHNGEEELKIAMSMDERVLF